MPIIILLLLAIFVVLPIIAVYYAGKGAVMGVKAISQVSGKQWAARQKTIQAQQKAQQKATEKITKLKSISQKNGKVFVDYGREQSTVTGCDSYLNNVSVQCSSDYVRQLFPSEYKHAVWRLEYITELRSTYIEHWQKISSLVKEAVRLLEKRNRAFDSNINDSQVDGIIELEDKALIGLNYICNNLDKGKKIEEINQEISSAQKELEASSDSVVKNSIETRIATNKKRLEKQTTAKNKLSHIQEEVKSLEATFKLIIEELESSIQDHRLDKASYKLSLNYSLSELQLPILDQMFLEQASSV